ncbi:MAG: phospholipase D-like domain-containing protein [Segniliparus sp.]|uniref:phospholipase D-like domain-containing protein n=1 Tax=Segniliparus sp. TaxID=2804064 RepID=UPI003F3D860D
MADGVWGAVKGFEPAIAQGIQGALADRQAKLSAFQGMLGSVRQLPGWQGPGKDAASGSFGEPLGYLAEARSATEQAHAKVGDFAQAMSALKAKAGEVEQRAARAGFSIGPDGSIRDSYALSGLVGSLSPADRAVYEQVKAELPGDVSSVLAQADQAKAQAATGLQAAGDLMAVSQLGAGADSTTEPVGGDELTLYVEGPHQPDGVNHDSNFQQVLKLIDGAQKSVDVTMYEFTDPAMRDALVAAAARGVNVRVVLDKTGEQQKDQPVFDYLNAHGVQAVWDDTADFRFTHQKTVTVDGETSAVMTGNFTPEYYGTSRDFAVIDTNKNDVAAIQDVFNHDFAGIGGTKTDGYIPPNGDHLVWSPTTAQTKIFAMIDGAQHTLSLDQQYVASQDIADHLVAAAQRGVDVNLTMVNNPSYYKYWDQLAAAGVHVHLYGQNADTYIHAKNIVADNSSAIVGSINLSDNSMLNNRELAIQTDDLDVVSGLGTTNASDFAGGYEYRPTTSSAGG